MSCIVSQMPPKKKANTVKEEAQAAENQLEEPLAAPEAEAPARTDLKRSETLYFTAGDIALCVGNPDDENTSESVVFRVDKVFLARHSSVLAAMYPRSNQHNSHLSSAPPSSRQPKAA